MEDNNLKENIRKRVKEKIAISNINEEFDKKSKKNRQIMYWITSSAAVFVLGIGLIIGRNNLKNTDGLKSQNYEIAELSQNEPELSVSQDIDNPNNELEETKMAKIDADKKKKEVGDLPEKIKFMKNISIPEDFKQQDIYEIYTNSNPKDRKYDLLHDYVFNYKKDDDNEIKIALSMLEEPIRDYWYDEENKKSKIEDVDVNISQYQNLFIVTFKIDNIYFDIEANGITENQLINIIKSIISQSKIDNK